ncbi:unnamed protein product [Amoebophrya sp. A25]|nr:unnamed protein product [Amoebophrya sp. A25]|eukprot:GSA25T00026788001.1
MQKQANEAETTRLAAALSELEERNQMLEAERLALDADRQSLEEARDVVAADREALAADREALEVERKSWLLERKSRLLQSRNKDHQARDSADQSRSGSPTARRSPSSGTVKTRSASKTRELLRLSVVSPDRSPHSRSVIRERLGVDADTTPEGRMSFNLSSRTGLT